jgi:hypothetical protein
MFPVMPPVIHNKQQHLSSRDMNAYRPTNLGDAQKHEHVGQAFWIMVAAQIPVIAVVVSLLLKV